MEKNEKLSKLTKSGYICPKCASKNTYTSIKRKINIHCSNCGTEFDVYEVIDGDRLLSDLKEQYNLTALAAKIGVNRVEIYKLRKGMKTYTTLLSKIFKETGFELTNYTL